MIVDAKGPLTLGHTKLLVEAAREGHGLAYVNEQDVLQDIARGRLVRLLSEWSRPIQAAACTTPTDAYRPGSAASST